MEKLWAEVDEYLANLLAPHDPALIQALHVNCDAGLPQIDVPASRQVSRCDHPHLRGAAGAGDRDARRLLDHLDGAGSPG
ncbi:MAG TPA: hypothetical protein VGL22_12570 [Terracidiphilus sp.]|jgi:hypothetical protein